MPDGRDIMPIQRFGKLIFADGLDAQVLGIDRVPVEGTKLFVWALMTLPSDEMIHVYDIRESDYDPFFRTINMIFRESEIHQVCFSPARYICTTTFNRTPTVLTGLVLGTTNMIDTYQKSAAAWELQAEMLAEELAVMKAKLS